MDPIDDSAVAARRKVWVALADLFLDTDVRMWYVWIARTLAESPFTLEELRMIFEREVAPALEANLLEVAGEWAGFDNDWVVSVVSKCAASDGEPVRFVNMDRHWVVLERLIGILRSTPPELRVARSNAWRALMTLFMDKQPRIDPPQDCSREQLASYYEDDLKPALMESVRRLAGNRLGIYPSESEVEANWLRFCRAQG